MKKITKLALLALIPTLCGIAYAVETKAPQKAIVVEASEDIAKVNEELAKEILSTLTQSANDTSKEIALELADKHQQKEIAANTDVIHAQPTIKSESVDVKCEKTPQSPVVEQKTEAHKGHSIVGNFKEKAKQIRANSLKKSKATQASLEKKEEAKKS